MNSLYSLEKLLWARQEDWRREVQNIELIPLRPNPAATAESYRLHPRIGAADSKALRWAVALLALIGVTLAFVLPYL